MSHEEGGGDVACMALYVTFRSLHSPYFGGGMGDLGWKWGPL